MPTYRRVFDGVGPYLITLAILPKKREHEFLPGMGVFFVNQEMVELAGDGHFHARVIRHTDYNVNDGHRLVEVQLNDISVLQEIHALHHYDEPPAEPETIPAVGTLWKHRNGDIYRIYDLTNLSSTRPQEYPVRVSYERLKDNTRWSKDVRGFLKSRKQISEDEYEAGRLRD